MQRGAGSDRTGSRRVRGRGRLSRSAEFDRVYRQGRSRSNRWLVVYSFPRPVVTPGDPGQPGPRLGLSVSRRVGGAVERSRVKRLLREAFRGVEGSLAVDHDFVLVARPGLEALAEREGLAGVARALGELVAPPAGGAGAAS